MTYITKDELCKLISEYPKFVYSSFMQGGWNFVVKKGKLMCYNYGGVAIMASWKKFWTIELER